MDQNQSLFSLTIDPVTKAHLSDTAKWARWLSVIGMVVLFLMLVFALLGSTVFTLTTGTTVSTIPEEDSRISSAMRFGTILGMILMVAILFFPLLFLYRFSGRMKTALAGNNQEALNTSFQYLKMTLRYLGIMVIITMGIYILVIAIGILAAAAN